MGDLTVFAFGPVLCCLAIAKRSVKNQVNSVEQW